MEHRTILIWLKKHRLTMFDNCKLLDLKDLSDLKKFKI